jgi:hypothetical protein
MIHASKNTFFKTFYYDGLAKSLFVKNFAYFGKKALVMFSIKTLPLKRDLIPRGGRVLVPLQRD